MRRVLRSLIAVVLLLALAVVGLGAYLVLGGGFVTYDRAALESASGRAAAPSWTAACRPDGPGVGGASVCGAVQGKVVYVQRHDPDGDGDLHLIVLAGTSVHLVKLPLASRPDRAPRLGTRIVAGGWMTRGASGRSEINARRLCSAGSTRGGCAATRAF